MGGGAHQSVELRAEEGAPVCLVRGSGCGEGEVEEDR